MPLKKRAAYTGASREHYVLQTFSKFLRSIGLNMKSS